MKKIICLVISMLMTVILAGCISWPEADTVQIETDIPIGGSNNQMPDPDDLQYFDTIEEAIMNNDMEITNLSIDKKIKLFENDECGLMTIIRTRYRKIIT